MGVYLDPGNDLYGMIKRNHVFVDHSQMIAYTNSLLGTESRYLCVCRPRRFGKSTDANMLVAYYSSGCDSTELFSNLKISNHESFPAHLNTHHVIHLNMQEFLSDCRTVKEMISAIRMETSEEICELYGLSIRETQSLPNFLTKVNSVCKFRCIFIIDEWDCIFREFKDDKDAQEEYLDFLRNLLKDRVYVELVYMTGILPIKKYGTHSAINMFDEISMIHSRPLSEYMGFTEEEVRQLCNNHHVDFNTMKDWYDGYQLTESVSTFSPKSVSSAITRGVFSNYWSQTETYEALKIYIDMNFDSLKDAIIELLNGNCVPVDPSSFQNDMTTFRSKDDVLTILIHLGYLGYQTKDNRGFCSIPNREVYDAFVTAVKQSDMKETAAALAHSQQLLEATLSQDEKKVAEYIEQAHLETSHLQYNDENALSYTVSLAYYAARDFYSLIREMPAGKGFADIVFLPKKDKPAMIVELKWNRTADTALSQIRDKQYPDSLSHYSGNLLLVGISYDRKTRKHSCRIETAVKTD